MIVPRATDAFRSLPLVLLALLEGWLLLDILAVGDGRWRGAAIVVWFVHVALFAASIAFRWRWARWLGLVALGGTYVGIHATVVDVALLPALAFVSLLIAQVELRILLERFAPVFVTSLSSEDRRRIGGALARAVARVSIACAMSIVVPLLAAQLIATGLFPLTSIATALLLSAALIAVVVLLALLPPMGRPARQPRRSSEAAKDN